MKNIALVVMAISFLMSASAANAFSEKLSKKVAKSTISSVKACKKNFKCTSKAVRKAYLQLQDKQDYRVASSNLQGLSLDLKRGDKFHVDSAKQKKKAVARLKQRHKQIKKNNNKEIRALAPIFNSNLYY
ncbi:MAG: hypothetical protein JKY82_12495 [Rhizobiaceae bacterium]|nr:hypothetical protein [Rhizobiaceae bacterium]